MTLATWKVRADVGLLDVEVNGDDVSSQVRRAALLLDRDRIPSLQLEIEGAGTIEGIGIVKVVLDDDQAEVPISQAVLRFLASVDPAELEQRALTGQMSEGPAVAFLAALKAMALA